MTGYGEAHRQQGHTRVAVEVRSINSRYFKLTFRCPEGYSVLEPQVESVVREHVKRGTVQVSLRMDRPQNPDDFQLDLGVLENYYRQVATLCRRVHEMNEINVSSMLALPGVVVERARDNRDLQEDWSIIETTLHEALESLRRMREEEGKAMAADMLENCREVARDINRIEVRVPLVAEAYRERLAERLKAVLTEFGVAIQPVDLIREVAIFAERCDVSEEIVRLRSHIEQFVSLVKNEQSSGRRLDFLTQEMFREANTVGSKSNDVEISQRVVDLKAIVERLREMVQNVE
jgi:uncharacterized protein (TIGR00255 family)